MEKMKDSLLTTVEAQYRQYRQWREDLKPALRLGNFPLALPEAAVSFAPLENSFQKSFKSLRHGFFAQPLAAEPEFEAHWKCLTANNATPFELQVVFGTLSHPRGDFHLPVFIAPILADSRPGYLHLRPSGKLELNQTLVKILTRRFGVSPSWLHSLRAGKNLNLDTVWDSLRSALQASTTGRKLRVQKTLVVGLCPQNWDAVDKDLHRNQLSYCSAPLVKTLMARNTTPGSETANPRRSTPALSRPDFFPPLPSDSPQLAVVEAIHEGHNVLLEGFVGTGKTTVVANAIADNLVAGKTSLVLGSPTSIKRLRQLSQRAGFAPLLLSLEEHENSHPQTQGQILSRIWREAWDNPVSYDSKYLENCRKSLKSLGGDLDTYVKLIHQPGPNQVSAWQALSAQVLTAAALLDTQISLATDLAQEPDFPTSTAQRRQAAKLGDSLSQIDSRGAGGISLNPWSLAGADLSSVDKAQLKQILDRLEEAIRQAHPAVLEIMSVSPLLGIWPVFARWLDLLEIGYGRSPVQVTATERLGIEDFISQLRKSLEQLSADSAELMQLATPAYRAGKDLDLLADARHAESAGGLSRRSRRKAIHNQLQPFLTKPIPVAQALPILEQLAALRTQAEALAGKISASKILGLPDFDPLEPGSLDRFHLHADTILTSVSLGHLLPGRPELLESLIPIARQGGNLGAQVRHIASAFADILDALHSTTPSLEQWCEGLPPLGRYLQVRKKWLQSLSNSDSSLDDMVAFRQISAQLEALGLSKLVQWVASGQIRGSEILQVLEYALSYSAVHERSQSLDRLGYSTDSLASLRERLTANIAEIRREIRNRVAACTESFSAGIEREQLRRFGALLRENPLPIRQIFRHETANVLARTPVIALTPQQLVQLWGEGSPIHFDTLFVLDAHLLPTGAALPALARANQAVVVAPSRPRPAPRTPQTLVESARAANFKSFKLRLRYGKDLAQAPALVTSWHGNDNCCFWPVAPDRSKFIHYYRIDSANSPKIPWLQNLDATVPAPSFSWASTAANFLQELSANNPQARIHAVTHTQEHLMALRASLFDPPHPRRSPLKNLQLSWRQCLPHGSWDVVVYFLSEQDLPPSSSTSISDALAEVVALAERAALVVQHFDSNPEARDPGENTDLDTPGEISQLLQELFESESSGREDRTAPDSDAPTENLIAEYLAAQLNRAGLEVRSQLGELPLQVDLAIRASQDSPWIALQLEGPIWAAIPDSVDRENSRRAQLTQHCGFALLEQVSLTDLLTNPDEVTRRIVSVALDLAFPGEITAGAVASEDSLASPKEAAPVHAPWPHNSLNLPKSSRILGAAPRVANLALSQDKNPVGKELSDSPPSTSNSMSDVSEQFSLPSSPVMHTVAPPQTVLSSSKDSPVFAADSLPSTPSQIQELPDSAFVHLSRDELSELPYGPTLAEYLGTESHNWIADLATVSPTDSVSAPGAVPFAPLEFHEDAARDSAALLQPELQTGFQPELQTGLQPEASADSVPPQEDGELVSSPLPQDTGSAVHNTLEIEALAPSGETVGTLGEKSVLDDLQSPQNSQAVSQALSQVLLTEGPIGVERLAKLVADAFGMKRLHPKRRDEILELLPSDAVVENTKFGDFAWPPHLSTQSFPYFRTGSIYGSRPITAICDTEFNNAMTWVIASYSPLEEELSELIAQALDLTSARTQMRPRVKAGLVALQQDNRLAETDGRYQLR